MPTSTDGFRMVERGRLARARFELPTPGPGEAVVRVSGCGVCHTDIAFLYDGVPTKHALPLVLGHEISGTVIEAGAASQGWVGKRVVVPAVAPCGTCAACKRGRVTSCRAGKMPGNDHDGGFADHVLVPAATLCDVDALTGAPGPGDALSKAGLTLADLSVVADAVTTPLEAIHRAGLTSGEVAIFVGTGGVGGFGVQLARAYGAFVVALDTDPRKLERALAHGAHAAFDARLPFKELKAGIREAVKKGGAPGEGWRVFETSGSPKGQESAFGLVNQGGSLSIVGFTPEPVTVRLSNLMAMDASAHGNWGSIPAVYPEAVRLCLEGKVQVAPFVKRFPLAQCVEVLEQVHGGGLLERAVLEP